MSPRGVQVPVQYEQREPVTAKLPYTENRVLTPSLYRHHRSSQDDENLREFGTQTGRGQGSMMTSMSQGQMTTRTIGQDMLTSKGHGQMTSKHQGQNLTSRAMGQGQRTSRGQSQVLKVSHNLDDEYHGSRKTFMTEGHLMSRGQGQSQVLVVSHDLDDEYLGSTNTFMTEGHFTSRGQGQSQMLVSRDLDDEFLYGVYSLSVKHVHDHEQA